MALLAGCTCAEEKGTFLERRSAHPTVLTRHAPAPQEYENEEPPEGVHELHYASGELSLRAWYVLPPGASPTAKVPAFVYFHGGYAFGASDFDVGVPFHEAGFAVFTPMLRGENGNPGDHERYWGELEDARAAVAWLQAQPEIDPQRVYLFGHSAGGVISGLLSLCEAPRVKLTGSSGGTYDELLFENSDGPFPFDVGSKHERRLRLFSPNAALMQQPHVAYVGDQDLLAKLGAETARRRGPRSLLEIVTLPGDHFSSFDAALARFHQRVVRDAAAKEPALVGPPPPGRDRTVSP